MNLYLIVFLLVAAGAVWERFRPEYGKKIYWVCWGLMTAALCFRFGQGTDYAGYHAGYDTQPLVVDLAKSYFWGVYPEIGWRVLSVVFRGILHAPFWIFTAALGLADMLLLHRFLKNFVKEGRSLGLVVAYPALYLIYMLSGLRQGLAICVLLGFALPFYMKKKWGRFVLCVLLAGSFHKVGFAWLALIPVYYLPFSWLPVLIGVAAAGGLLLQIEAVQNLIVSLIPFYSYRLYQLLFSGGMSLPAIGERVLSFLVVLFLFQKLPEEERHISSLEPLMKVYTCTILFYLLMSGNSYYASRYASVFKVMEIALAPCLLKNRDFWRQAGFAFFGALALLMSVKNINAMIREGFYDAEKINWLNYPYVSVFQREDIEQYINYQEKYDFRCSLVYEDQELWRLEE